MHDSHRGSARAPDVIGSVGRSPGALQKGVDMNVRSRLVAGACILPILVYGLVASVAAIASTPAVEDHLLLQLTDVENACHPYSWLVTGGKPSADALEALTQAGIHDVFDLRGASEPRDFDEAAVARSMNLHYLSIPVTPADFSDATFTAFRHHLIAHGPDNPMFIHCASGNRVGAALLPWLVLDKGLSEDAALEMARAVGLHSPELTERALEYIRTHERPKQ
jgi:protein tyrosine phosphatase (PTP) superfamily phosphohydrolase (DUF442 family)